MKILNLFLVISVIMGFATQLTAIAKDTSDKTIMFSHDMNDAISCAFKGVDLTECAPDIYNVSFDEENEEFTQTVDNMSVELGINDGWILVYNDTAYFVYLVNMTEEYVDFTSIDSDTSFRLNLTSNEITANAIFDIITQYIKKIRINDYEKIDMDKDGTYDLKITYKELKDGKAKVDVHYINEKNMLFYSSFWFILALLIFLGSYIPDDRIN